MSAQAPVLLDTSVWISYFRPNGWEDLKESVKSALTEGRVQTCWTVKSELLIGARDESGFDKLIDWLSALSEVPVNEQFWMNASRLGHDLRREGLTIPLPDLLIAQAAILGDSELWHVDEHFEQIKSCTSLKTYSFLPQDT